jgi:predicted lipoprotein
MFSLLCACRKDQSDETPTTYPALRHIAETYILPGYSALYSELTTLETETGLFLNQPDETSLGNLRLAHKSAWLSWQRASCFGFGPAEIHQLKEKLNTFPADTSDIEERILTGTGSPGNNDTGGFPAVDYLLYRPGFSDAQIAASFAGLEGAQRRTYLQTCIAQMRAVTEAVKSDWNHAYFESFANAQGQNGNSSLSLLVNSYIIDYEWLKRNKIALPLGLLTLGIPLETRTEAYFGGYSLELAMNHLKFLREMFASEYGIGFDDMLNEVGASKNGGPLDEAILAVFDQAISQGENLQDPLSQQILSDPDPVTTFYQTLQSNVVLLKTDMTSALGVSITYSDNDGD